MDFKKVREAVEDYASGICSDVNAPASHLPERVVDWIAQAFINDYLDEGEKRLPDYNDVLKGMCDYLQEECSEDSRYLFEKQKKIDELKITLDSMGYDVEDFSDADLIEIYDSAYEALTNDDEYNSAYSEVVRAAVEEFLNRQFKCPLGGDETNDCADCAYSGDYHFVDGECLARETSVG